MSKIRNISISLLATIIVAFVVGCGQETVSIPGVVSVTPVQGAVNISIGTTVTATFSMAMSSASITASTFTLTGPGGAAVAGAVTYNGMTATFTPASVLAYETTYTATITRAASTPGGTGLSGNYVWSFSTITPPPAVVSTVPANGSVNVSTGQVLSATFSEGMNSATISASTFTVMASGVSVPGTVTYAGLVATFTPASSFANSTVYTATITTGATSVAGTPLASNYIWTFTTITPPPFVMATVPMSAATGVPIGQALTATFNEAMSCTPFPAIAFTLVAAPGATPVPGTISCMGAVATFTPAANLAYNTVYTATITTGARSLAGTPLAANYVWTFRTLPAPILPTVISTVPVNGATSVPINQALSATFSEAMNAATIDAATFTLQTTIGGTSVSGSVAYVAAGSVATFMPAANLAPTTEYTATITTGAMDLAGNALAQNYAWTFTTAALPISVPPTVISTIPANTSTGVPLNQIVSATFDEAMNPATISSATFMLTGPGNVSVTGLVAYAAIGNTLTFTPTANLAANTMYAATITTGAMDLAGISLASNYVWTFTTGTTLNSLAPELVVTVPANLATNVPLNQAVTATFTKAMNPLTLNTTTFQLMQGLNPIPATITYDAINFIATLTPTNLLTANTSYTAAVTNGATDLDGNPLGTSVPPQNPWTFTTGTTSITPPVVLGPTIALFGGFGGTAGLTNQGIETVINGDIGTTAVSTLITGFHDTSVMAGGVAECTYTEPPLNKGLVNGTINTAPPPPTVGCPNEGTAATYAIVSQAALEALTAFNTLAAIPGGIDVSTLGGGAGELGNRTLAPGVYKSAPGSYAISLGDLTLDAQGDPNASWVFQMATTLTVGTPASHQSVILVNGAQANNVFWQVGTAATINGILGGGTMVGTIISQDGVSISTAGVVDIMTLNGRALVLTGPVTMVNTVINVP